MAQLPSALRGGPGRSAAALRRRREAMVTQLGRQLQLPVDAVEDAKLLVQQASSNPQVGWRSRGGRNKRGRLGLTELCLGVTTAQGKKMIENSSKGQRKISNSDPPRLYS